ncbi:hypothetical protein [Fusibacter sp. 3D3]|uniref:hypothetical protein n=1 Tax=Fusibacter sp. 3D3 TaxID=1048380 RepID=UPI000853C9C7|nr:hypothetical protein [Fusibacter sp. 3D3]GAU76461.1 hypothetical protein F3D3_1058 [Fusibacter sp. 3D3]
MTYKIKMLYTILSAVILLPALLLIINTPISSNYYIIGIYLLASIVKDTFFYLKGYNFERVKIINLVYIDVVLCVLFILYVFMTYILE